MTRLIVGQNSYLDLEYVNEYWWQVVHSHRVPGARVGYMVRKTTRGYEAFHNLSDTCPRVILPNRCTLTDEEE